LRADSLSASEDQSIGSYFDMRMLLPNRIKD
jgi:hypothetical protein